MIEKKIRSKTEQTKQSTNHNPYADIFQLAQMIGNQGILQFQNHHVIPKEIWAEYGPRLNNFDEDTTVEIQDHNGSHGQYTDAVKRAIIRCIELDIDPAIFARALKTHLIGTNSVGEIDFEYLLRNIIQYLPKKEITKTKSGTRHRSVVRYDPSPK